MKYNLSFCLAAVAGGVVSCASMSASADLFVLSDPSGLSAEVEFTIINPTTLGVRLRNTSTGVPGGFDSSDQLLTGVSWDFGAAGANGTDPQITGGSVRTGANSQSINFSILNVGSNADVSGEYGYGNGGTTGLLPNILTGNQAGSTPFGGANLDGPGGLNGPQAGLVADPILVPLGGLGAIQDEIVAELTLDREISDLAFLHTNGITVEYGSDAAFIFIPAPGAITLCGLAGAVMLRRRRR